MMSNREFDPLYKDRELKRKILALCRRYYSSNRKAWEHGSPGFGPAFEAEELEQEVWIFIATLKPGQQHGFYLTSAENFLKNALKTARRRSEIAPTTGLEEAGLVSEIWGRNPDFPGEAGAIRRAQGK